jgi:hypothetical protein
MRVYLEANEREHKMRDELGNRLESVAFGEWAAYLAIEDRSRLVPPTDFAKPGGQGHNVHLKQHFRETVWQERRKSLQGSQASWQRRCQDSQCDNSVYPSQVLPFLLKT